jgi:hypothetical protein
VVLKLLDVTMQFLIPLEPNLVVQRRLSIVRKDRESRLESFSSSLCEVDGEEKQSEDQALLSGNRHFTSNSFSVQA